MEDFVAGFFNQYCHHGNCDNSFKVNLWKTTEKRRQELEKYFDPKGPLLLARAQMKRAWKQANRRELTWWENTYLPCCLAAFLTSKHFFHNLTSSYPSSVWALQRYSGGGHLSISGKAAAIILSLKDPPPPDQARGRFSPLCGLHDV